MTPTFFTDGFLGNTLSFCSKSELFRVKFCYFFSYFEMNMSYSLPKMLLLVSVIGTSWPLKAVGFFSCIVALVTDASRDHFRVYYIDCCRYSVRFNWSYSVFSSNMTPVTLPLGTSWPLEAVWFFSCIVVLVADVSRDHFRVYYIDWYRYSVRFNWNYIIFSFNMTPVTLPLGTLWPLGAVGFFPCIVALVTNVSRDHFRVYYTELKRYSVRFD